VVRVVAATEPAGAAVVVAVSEGTSETVEGVVSTVTGGDEVVLASVVDGEDDEVVAGAVVVELDVDDGVSPCVVGGAVLAVVVVVQEPSVAPSWFFRKRWYASSVWKVWVSPFQQMVPSPHAWTWSSPEVARAAPPTNETTATPPMMNLFMLPSPCLLPVPRRGTSSCGWRPRSPT
jgi:hypothetical protein